MPARVRGIGRGSSALAVTTPDVGAYEVALTCLPLVLCNS